MLTGVESVVCGALAVGAGSPSASAARPFAYAQTCAAAPVFGGHFSAAPSFSGVSSATASDAWAVGSYPVNSPAGIAAIADHWDGRRWQVVYPPTAGQDATGLNGVAARTPADVWAVGFAEMNTLAEHWNRTAWSIVPSPHIGGQQNINDFNAVAAFAPDRALAVGHTGCQQSAKPLVERWNGSAWSVVSTPAPAHGGLYGKSGSSAADVWTVGADGAGRPLVLRLNGRAWQRVIVPVPAGTKYALLDGVLDRAPGDVWAVGGYSPDGSSYHNLIEHWDGHAWTVIGSRGQFPAGAAFAGAAPSGARTLVVGAETDEPVSQLFALAECR